MTSTVAQLNRAEAKKIVNLFACPSCGVGPGELCLNLSKRDGTTNNWPHPDRIELLFEKPGSRLSLVKRAVEANSRALARSVVELEAEMRAAKTEVRPEVRKLLDEAAKLLSTRPTRKVVPAKCR